MLATVKRKYPTFSKCAAAYSSAIQRILLADLEKAYSEKSLTLSELGCMYNSNSPILWVKTQLLSLDFASSQKEGADMDAITEFSELFVNQYPHIKLTEFLLFIARFKLGRYGKFYGYFDTLTIGEGFRKFLRERSDELDMLIRKRNNETVERRYQNPVVRDHAMPDYLRCYLDATKKGGQNGSGNLLDEKRS